MYIKVNFVFRFDIFSIQVDNNSSLFQITTMDTKLKGK